MVQESVTATGAESAEVTANRELLRQARTEGRGSLLKAFIRLSGPGWLQSAITLGGGSLASSLYLGVLAGTALLWLQPLAMIIGIIMLSTIGYVVLSTGERPFRAINRHVSPVLGWGWLLATMMANMVWSLPQFSLGTAAVRQNLFPRSLGTMSDTPANALVCAVIAILATVVVVLYDQGRRGARICDAILKVMVAAIILSFFGVVVKLTLASGLDWGAVWAGFIPDFSLLNSPPETLTAEIARVAEPYRDYWRNLIVNQQRGVMIAAAATAVGINMTFLLPYSMLKRGWDRDFRGMAVFDLATGLFVPFVVVTACVIIVASSQFHTTPAPGFLGETDAAGNLIKPEPKLVGKVAALTEGRLKFELGQGAYGALSDEEIGARLLALPDADKRLAAMLVTRDAFSLADSLRPLMGRAWSHYVFGIGVFGMAVSTIIILMLINGFVICEILDRPPAGRPFVFGSLLPLVGILGPFIYRGKAQFWLAVPTSNIAFVFLPIAYLSFAFLLNNRRLLGDAMPTGGKRLLWNLLVFPSAGLAAVGSIWKLWNGLGWYGIAILGAVLVACVVFHPRREKPPTERAGHGGRTPSREPTGQSSLPPQPKGLPGPTK